jgi:hypothetical protein
MRFWFKNVLKHSFDTPVFFEASFIVLIPCDSSVRRTMARNFILPPVDAVQILEADYCEFVVKKP